MRTEKRGFYSYVYRFKFICISVSVFALIWGNYFYTICRMVLSFHNFFPLVMYSGWKLRVTAIHRHRRTRLHGVIKHNPKLLILTTVKISVLYYIKNILTVTADCILLCFIIGKLLLQRIHAIIQGAHTLYTVCTDHAVTLCLL